MHRALKLGEIPALVDMFRLGAQRAAAAGFDAVELHAANGYLVDTFLQDGTTGAPTTTAGGVAGRPASAAAGRRVRRCVRRGPRRRAGLPSGNLGSISDSDPETTFGYFAERLSDLKIAYLHRHSNRASAEPRPSQRDRHRSPRHSYANTSPDRSSPPADSMASAPATSCGAGTQISSRSDDCSLQP